MTARFIVLEGIDGSGTTTQAARLGRKLAAQVTREPSQGPIGAELRKVLGGHLVVDDGAIALLFAADRLDHLAREIEPQLSAGVHVVSDRYLLSSLAYQSLTVGRSFVEAINQRARKPDLTLLLDVPVEVAAARRRSRGGPPELFDADAFQARVAEAYRAEAHRLQAAGEPIVIVDGTPDPDRVFAALEQALKTCLSL